MLIVVTHKSVMPEAVKKIPTAVVNASTIPSAITAFAKTGIVSIVATTIALAVLENTAMPAHVAQILGRNLNVESTMIAM